MDSGKNGRSPNQKCGKPTEVPVSAGRTIECYHYHGGQIAEGATQPKGRQVLLEHVPALLQAAGLH